MLNRLRQAVLAIVCQLWSRDIVRYVFKNEVQPRKLFKDMNNSHVKTRKFLWRTKNFIITLKKIVMATVIYRLFCNNLSSWVIPFLNDETLSNKFDKDLLCAFYESFPSSLKRINWWISVNKSLNPQKHKIYISLERKFKKEQKM